MHLCFDLARFAISTTSEGGKFGLSRWRKGDDQLYVEIPPLMCERQLLHEESPIFPVICASNIAFAFLLHSLPVAARLVYTHLYFTT
jgi:hypothetical protein